MVYMNPKDYNWYQSIELLSGEKTPGGHAYDGALKDRFCLPENLAGKTVLEFGTYDGFWAAECQRRGASNVVAVDYHILPTATFVLGERHIDYRAGPEFDLDRPYSEELHASLGQYDMVMFCGILYHLKNPLVGLCTAARCCKSGGTAIVESSVNQVPAALPFSQDYPLLWLVDGSEPEGIVMDSTNYVIPNPLAVIKLCKMAGLVSTGQTGWSEDKCRMTVVTRPLRGLSF